MRVDSIVVACDGVATNDNTQRKTPPRVALAMEWVVRPMYASHRSTVVGIVGWSRCWSLSFGTSNKMAVAPLRRSSRGMDKQPVDHSRDGSSRNGLAQCDGKWWVPVKLVREMEKRGAAKDPLYICIHHRCSRCVFV